MIRGAYTPSLRVQTAPELEDAGSSIEVPLPFSEVDWICKESSSFLFGN